MLPEDTYLCSECDGHVRRDSPNCPACGEALVWCPTCGCPQSVQYNVCGDCGHTFSEPVVVVESEPSLPFAETRTESLSGTLNVTTLTSADVPDAPKSTTPEPPSFDLSETLDGWKPRVDLAVNTSSTEPPPATRITIAMTTAPQAPVPAPASFEFESTPIARFGGGRADGAPMAVEIELPRRAYCRKQTLIRIRVWDDGLEQETNVKLTMDSGLVGAKTFETRLDPGASHQFDSVSVVPRTPGSAVVRVALELTATASGEPLGRWRGETVLTVVENAYQGPAVMVTGDVAGDVRLVGDVSVGKQRGDFDEEFIATAWNRVPLQVDRETAKRLARARPLTKFPVSSPTTPARLEHFQALVQSSLPNLRAINVVCGEEAAMGRGSPQAAWWVRPEPNTSADRYHMISRRHVVFRLRDDRAWISDVSSQGVWLNGVRLPPGETMLCDGDTIGLVRDVLPLRVVLTGDGRRVTAVLLRRSDAAANRVAYLLTNNRLPASLDGSWLAWSGDALRPELQWLTAGEIQWRSLRLDDRDDATLRFRVLAEPQRPDDDLLPF